MRLLHFVSAVVSSETVVLENGKVNISLKTIKVTRVFTRVLVGLSCSKNLGPTKLWWAEKSMLLKFL
jgi:hypothetical protein